jgi:hypothetical protein
VTLGSNPSAPTMKQFVQFYCRWSIIFAPFVLAILIFYNITTIFISFLVFVLLWLIPAVIIGWQVIENMKDCDEI